MSVSEMNLSWSTMSNKESQHSMNSSVFLTQKGDGSPRKQKCLSAKISGMRFPGWKEPKPLRQSRASSAVAQPVEDENVIPMTVRHKKREPVEEAEVKSLIKRLSQPTLSSKGKSTRTRARDPGVDMNWYSWSKMNIYKDYQRVLYSKDGTVKKSMLVKER